MDDKSKEQARIRMKKMRERNKGVTSECVTDKSVTNYVIPMTRKAAIEICKANHGNSGALTGEVKRKVFSALHNLYDCRYFEQ